MAFEKASFALQIGEVNACVCVKGGAGGAQGGLRGGAGGGSEVCACEAAFALHIGEVYVGCIL